MNFEKHLCSVSMAASERLGALRKSCRVFHDWSLLGRCFLGFVLSVLEYCSAAWCSAADTHPGLLDRVVSGALFLTGGVFECDLLIVDPWQYCVSCIRSGAIRCTLLMMLFLDRMCQCGLHAVLWAHIGSLMRFLAAEPRCTAWPLFLSQCHSRTILLALYSMVGTGGFQEQGQCLFIGLSCSILTIVFYYFPLFILPIHRLVLSGWGRRTERVDITLSQPCTADLFW